MLFKTHFVLFHALYRLKAHWQQTGTGNLDIHTLNIQLHEISHASHGASGLQNKDKLAEYYLNWDNFQQTNRNEVESLLDDFWQSMAKGSACVFSPQDIEEAHTLLQLPSVENGDMPLPTLKSITRKHCYRLILTKVGVKLKHNPLFAHFKHSGSTIRKNRIRTH